MSSVCSAYGLTRSNFLSHGPSAAAFGRGETAVSSLDEPSAQFYNPALIAEFTRPGAYLSHFMLAEGSNYTYAAIAQPLKKKKGTLSFSALNLKSGDVEIRQTLVDTPSTISTSQSALFLSAARTFQKLADINFGVNVKYILLDLYYKKGGAFGLDAGASRGFSGPRILGNRSSIDTGLVVENLVAPSITLDTTADTYARVVKAGTTLTVPTKLRALSQDTAAIAVDLAMAENALKYFAGLEYVFTERYFLRAGLYENHYTAGVGLKLKYLQIDYALDFSDFATFNRIGLAYYWGRQKGGKSNRKKKEDAAFMQEANEALKESREREHQINLLFDEAKSEYDRKHFLRASDKFKQITITFPESESAFTYHTRITEKMKENATSANLSNFEEISYARGFMSFQEDNFKTAVNEWAKALQFNPGNDELLEYSQKAQNYLKDAEREQREKAVAQKVQSTFNAGVADFDAAKWIGCIKKMEKTIQLCQAEEFSGSIEWIAKSKDYISRSVSELAKTVQKKPRRSAEETAAESKPAPETDTAGADKKYREGLVLYAQGKLFDAMKTWEIATRLNPDHEKAWKALERVKEELNVK